MKNLFNILIIIFLSIHSAYANHEKSVYGIPIPGSGTHSYEDGHHLDKYDIREYINNNCELVPPLIRYTPSFVGKDKKIDEILYHLKNPPNYNIKCN